ncbi:sugar transferase [bacterium]|nr:sugar transferase [bacterium]
MNEVIIYRLARRILQIVFAVLVLIITSPLILIASIAVKLSSPGPILYKGTRMGKNKKPYTLYKFRTMCADAEIKLGGRQLKKSDAYLTRVGHILRSSKVDELPQLLNVIKGDMNLVGPRPLKTEVLEEILQEFPHYVKRFEVKPGMTGLAQVSHGYYIKAHDRVHYDIFYIQHRSLVLDIKIVARTVYLVVIKKPLLAILHRFVFWVKSSKNKFNVKHESNLMLQFRDLPANSLLIAYCQNFEPLAGQAVIVDEPKALKKTILPLLKQEIAIHPQVADLHNNLGLIYLGNRQYDVACSAFKQAITINGNFADALENLGDCYFELDDYTKALQSFEAAFDVNENKDPKLPFKIGLTLAKLGEHATAVEQFKYALTLDPEFSEAKAHLKSCLNQLGWDTD